MSKRSIVGLVIAKGVFINCNENTKISNIFLDYVKDYNGLKILDFVASQVNCFDR